MRRKSLALTVLAIVLVLAIGGTAAFAANAAKPGKQIPKVYPPITMSAFQKAGKSFKLVGDVLPALSKDTTLTAAFLVLKWDGAKYAQFSTVPAAFAGKGAKYRQIGAKLTLADAEFYKLKSALLSNGVVVATSRATAMAVWPVDATSTPTP
jgi:hypothetical protein